ncbi:MAG: leucine--tRNA ligase [Bdellovibrionales bacterium GWA2_49_15]|nr:MAG: leucine--tRNA ligase [Bdellovibrionales bacterium GWA2_49_15]HAZ11277.1 leucine--tRNA ligase [Bdellovibrionales bacterium]
MNYDHRQVEEKILSEQQKRNDFFCDVANAGKKFYSLGMFPYPSGNAHMGHVLVYTLSDVKARFKKLKGHEVLHPMGWDAFGLPAENAAIKHKVRPDSWTKSNIQKMKTEQLNGEGWSFDWDKELNTSSPDYYRWTQWLFLEMLKANMAYKKAGYVNWCPIDQTVLANEQVINGCCYRDGAAVEKRLMEQWFFKITAYAPKLWDDLEKLTHWAPEAVAVQRNWINKNIGTNIDFSVGELSETIRVFTTRADTLFGVCAVVIAPEHPLVAKILSKNPSPEIKSYVEAALKKSQVERMQSKEKTGIKTSVKCQHPFPQFAPEKEIAVWIGDYVIGDYGSGAVMCVPGHDTRDFEFAQKFRLPVYEVIVPSKGVSAGPLKEAFTELGTLINSGTYSALSSQAAIEKITHDLVAKGRGEATTTFQLRDWSVGRQRFWGCPIPIIYCQKCGTVPVPEKDLPVELPIARDSDMEDGVLNLRQFHDFVNTKCPNCHGPAKRETDTLDTFLCSSWYAFRFIDNKNAAKPFDSKLVNQWMPVDFYVGGIEHAAQHMIYFRFITKFLKDRGLVNFDEPVDYFFCNGMVRQDGAKMSKSKGNIVIPTEVINAYGGDALRFYILSDTPAELDRDWDDKGIKAKQEFIRKNFNNLSTYLDAVKHIPAQRGDLSKFKYQELLFDLFGGLAQLEEQFEKNLFNNAVAKVHELSNSLLKVINTAKDLTDSDHATLKSLVLDYLVAIGVLLPFTAETLLKEYYGKERSIYKAAWPVIEKQYLARDVINIAVQINGKKRALIEIKKNASESEALTVAFADADVQRNIEGKEVLKKIYVPGKIINIVIKG